MNEKITENQKADVQKCVQNITHIIQIAEIEYKTCEKIVIHVQ
jgi:hypothetical protein